MDVSPEKSSEPSAASSVDYLVWLVCEFLCDEVSIEISVGIGDIGDRCPSRHLFEIVCHVFLG